VALTVLLFYKDGQTVPIREWLKALPLKARIKCLGFLGKLEAHGHELRRPTADFLRDGIYELRPSHQGVNYRILYFFAGKQVVVVSHGITKEAKVPDIEIRRAIDRKHQFELNPEAHTHTPGV
jgi:hypothetical protein